MSVTDIATIASDFLSLGALLGLVVSLRMLRHQTKATADQARFASIQAEHAAKATLAAACQNLWMQMHDINRFFVDRPELKPYFGDDAAVPLDPAERLQVECVAEMFIDFIDNFVAQGPLLDERLLEGWGGYFLDLYDHSPALQSYWARCRAWYRPAMRELLDERNEDVLLGEVSN